ncbi:MAG: pyridine nucleotide-disulfide oxidoreductase [Spirochaetes bacterium GWF1_41_5]|nr:MAG: pyridine nucleotide-disulfide oxidoreductase [Spirochaetes bacterium GWF1_41_5]HBE02677.1 pyridine nucleotide-disulfide oxidoreductase [Spirochaetia bacterium]
MFETGCDVAVIGGGAAGLAAANEAARLGAKVMVIDREACLGGILQQCIHTGFGLTRFREELSGPEYAGRDIALARSRQINVLLESTVLDAENVGKRKTLLVCSRSHGAMKVHAHALVLAMGCRERNRGNLGIAGSRPAGVMTAGLAQRLANLEGCLPGRRTVIIGSGDIGLIMARRMTWIGAKVLAVVEIMPYPSGIARNIAQCLDDYKIPLFLSHAVTAIHGRNRVESVVVSPLINGIADTSKTFTLECDTVLLSVGLIPENELSKKIGVKLSLSTGGPQVDSSYMTNIPGIFACGNVLHVHDLVDNVSLESTLCGVAVYNYLNRDGAFLPKEFPVSAGVNLKYVLPSTYRLGAAQRFSMRALAPFDDAELLISSGGSELIRKHLRFVRPSEMLTLDVPADKLPLGNDISSIEVSLIKKESAG